MKKFIVICALATISAVAYGQAWLYTETFEQKAILDMNVGLAKIKEMVNENCRQNNVTDPLTKALVTKVAESTYKKSYKKMMEERYVTDYPDGSFTLYGKFDIVNDRVAYFCPQLGRVIIQDFKNRKQYIVFPKLNVYLQNDIDKSVQSACVTFTATAPIPEYAKKLVSDVNGFRAMGNCGLIPANAASVPENIVEVNGQACEMIPLPGHVLVKEGDVEYYTGIYVEALIGGGVNEGQRRLVQWEKGNVNPANFELTAGLTVAKDIKALNKTVQKAVEENQIGVSDPGHNPENNWDCFK